ncbi:hypothetical protein HYH02_008670 [Chlamydomonas schloesseri]|uniref:Nuclear GTPase SLIP-GC n=1 Tax=Chlamydomonas schloesseri TaxID=2026947 RepID=A0A835WD46_9CHLO|nr:hypothetical protein HYH02_008670 [Chlamydomonas schloesseri]|eukprot:KAG2445202.1 hypothetical protein HYH02_008670 [Chlamydomonas schloesseri]
MVTLVPGDEVLFGPAGAAEPADEPEVAFLLQSVDAEVGAALLRSATAPMTGASQASAGVDALLRSGYVKCETRAPSGPDAGGAAPLMLTFSQPGTTPRPAGAPAAAAQAGLPLATPLSHAIAAGPAIAAGAALAGGAAAFMPAAAGTAGTHAAAVLASGHPTAAARGHCPPAGGPDLAAGPAAGADVDMVPREEAAPTTGAAAVRMHTPAPAQQHQQQALAKGEPVDGTPLSEQQQQQPAQQQDPQSPAESAGAEQQQQQQQQQPPPSARATKTHAGRGVDAVLNECRDIVDAMGEVLFPEPAAEARGDQSAAGPSNGAAGAGAGAGTSAALAGPQMSALWRGELQSLLQRATMPRTTIGVVGDTGAGKSSLLNALLGEEDILPTNAMRASTGCPIELSHAASGDYAAEVEFQSMEEWEKYLDKLLSDLLDEDGELKVVRSEGAVTSKSEAGVAQAMLEAVYGQQLIREPGLCAGKLRAHSNRITQLLGKAERIRHGSAKKFREKVGVYVDSHNKATSLQAWPIVKVCRIAHRWKLLEGGVVLVDLPGTRDANEARGRVAEEYMRRLSAVWIVADITRAVDNKTAKDLLGTDFKRRMVMDGQVHAITFICTKTDNLDVSSILNSLSIEEVCARSGTDLVAFNQLDETIMNLQDQELAAEKATKQAKRKATLALSRCRKAATAARKIRDSVLQRCRAAGVAVPDELAHLMRQAVPPPGKDKKGGGSAGQQRGSEDEDEEDEDKDEEMGGASSSEEELTDSDAADDSSSDGDSDDSGAGSDDDYVPSEDELGEDSDDGGSSGDEDDDEDGRPGRRRQRRKARGGKRKRVGGGRGRGGGGGRSKKQKKAGEPKELRGKEVSELMHELRQEVAAMPGFKAQYAAALQEQSRAEKVQAEASQWLKKPQVQMRTICAVARNDYSRERLQEDFREGITEMLQQSGDRAEAAAALDVNAIDLPVFCVSSREAQKLEGIVRRDRKASVFSKLADTQLPKLRQHVTRTADSARLCAQRRLAQDVYAALDSVGRTLLSQRPDGTPDVSAAVQRSVGRSLAALPKRLDAYLKAKVSCMAETFVSSGLAPQLQAGSALAVERAPAAAKKFDLKPCEPTLRMGWSTFRAALRRDGVFNSGAAGQINWNGALVQPLMDRITATWARLFQTELPQLTKATQKGLLDELDACVQLARAALEAELAPLKGGPVLLSAQLDRLSELYDQVRRDQDRQLAQALGELQSGLVEASKALSQDVVEPAVKAALGETYLAAANERGTGSFMRMKQQMEIGVAHLARTMLPAAAQALLAEVEKLVVKFGDSASAAALVLVDAVRTRFELLWDDAPAGYEARYEAAAQLAQLLERAGQVCARAGVTSLPPAFVLPPPPAREAAEEEESEEEEEEEEEVQEEEAMDEDEGAGKGPVVDETDIGEQGRRRWPVDSETLDAWFGGFERDADEHGAQRAAAQEAADSRASGGGAAEDGEAEQEEEQEEEEELRQLEDALAGAQRGFDAAGAELTATIMRMKEARRDGDEGFDSDAASRRCSELAAQRMQAEYEMDRLRLSIKQLEAQRRARAATGAAEAGAAQAKAEAEAEQAEVEAEQAEPAVASDEAQAQEEGGAVEGADAVITVQLVRPGAAKGEAGAEAGGQAAEASAVGTV